MFRLAFQDTDNFIHASYNFPIRFPTNDCVFTILYYGLHNVPEGIEISHFLTILRYAEFPIEI